jgi:NAD(P)-dependent dehydrogenase (short-subunit alcohol dehydrogenase family)
VSQRIVAITGAANGIGAATARALAQAGDKVILIDVSEAARELATELGGVAVVGDVSVQSTWDDAAELCRHFGRVDVLVANAALQVVSPLVELEPDDWDRQIAVNLRGTYLGTRTLLPLLTRATGSVVIVSSVHASAGLSGFPAYATSKAGLTGLTRQLAVDYAPIRVNCVLPGPILTRVWDEVPESDRARSAGATALKRMGRPEEVASVISFLASDAAAYVTGACVPVDGGWLVTKDSV